MTEKLREKRLVICLTEEEHRLVVDLSKQEDRSMNVIVRRLLRNAFRQAGMPVTTEK